MDKGRLITAWIDLELAFRHLHTFGNEQVETSHWLRIAHLNLKASADGNPDALKLVHDTGKWADKLDIILFNLHGKITIDEVQELSPQIENAQIDLRRLIHSIHEEAKV